MAMAGRVAMGTAPFQQGIGGRWRRDPVPTCRRRETISKVPGSKRRVHAAVHKPIMASLCPVLTARAGYWLLVVYAHVTTYYLQVGL
jgi:hypothetical protein